MQTGLESITSALGQLASGSEEIREKGFIDLMKRSRPYVHSLIAHRLPSEADREDVMVIVSERIWNMRDRLDCSEPGSWFCLVRTIANNCTIDALRARGAAVSVDDPDFRDIPASEHGQVMALVQASLDRKRLYRLADEAFLGLESGISERDHTRQLLAAKLLLVDHVPWREVCRILNSSADEDEQWDRSDLDRIMSSASVLMLLAYFELHWDNERLSEYLLKHEACPASSAETPREWAVENVVEAIKLRFQYALLFDQILSRMRSRLKKSELIEIFDICVQNFPFIEIMSRLLQDAKNIPGAKDHFASQGLWHRLMFQYHCENELPHRDILDRTVGAAAVAGFEMTKGKINVGLSNGRLFKRLAEHLTERNGSVHV